METLKANGNSPDKKNSGNIRDIVMGRLEILGIRPNENLGQHFLIDDAPIGLLVQAVSPNSTVIEIGAGVGQLTEALARKATRVISIEVDKRYEPVLTQVTKRNPNVQVIFGDAVALNLQSLIPEHEKEKGSTGVQIVANLPFHITEPFLHKIAGLPIESATLVVGQRLAYAIQVSSEENVAFGRLTLLAQTFFDTDVVSIIEKQKSFPVPRTDLAIIRLTPKDKHEFRSNRRGFLLGKLFLTAKKSPLVKNALKESLIEFAETSEMGTLSKRKHHQRLRSTVKSNLKRMTTEYNHSGSIESFPQKPTKGETRELTQNLARDIIGQMGIPETILNKPFGQLNNNELQVLSKALGNLTFNSF
jgi:16S rRNA (adenine1518-N6/adenine1519-N6)-dimethyltransferase